MDNKDDLAPTIRYRETLKQADGLNKTARVRSAASAGIERVIVTSMRRRQRTNSGH